MKAGTRALAWVWLCLAALGLPVAGGAGYALARGVHEFALFAVALCLLVGGVILWTVPLGLASLALLRGRQHGWWVLIVHAGLACPAWAYVARSAWPDLRPQFLGCLAMLVFSAATVLALAIDPPRTWT